MSPGIYFPLQLACLGHPERELGQPSTEQWLSMLKRQCLHLGRTGSRVQAIGERLPFTSIWDSPGSMCKKDVPGRFISPGTYLLLLEHPRWFS